MIVSIDLEYRGQEYRIAEMYRRLGGSIRPVEGTIQCVQCPRKLGPGARHYRSGNQLVVLCIPCAIDDGHLRVLDLEERYRVAITDA